MGRREWKCPGWAVWATHTGTLYIREAIDLVQVVDADAVFHMLCDPRVHHSPESGSWLNWWPHWAHA